MGFDLDMTRGYGFNRGHIKRMQSKRQFMRQLYIKGLKSQNYSPASDDIPPEVISELKREIRRKYASMRVELWIKTFSGFILVFTFLLLLLFVFLRCSS